MTENLEEKLRNFIKDAMAYYKMSEIDKKYNRYVEQNSPIVGFENLNDIKKEKVLNSITYANELLGNEEYELAADSLFRIIKYIPQDYRILSKTLGGYLMAQIKEQKWLTPRYDSNCQTILKQMVDISNPETEEFEFATKFLIRNYTRNKDFRSIMELSKKYMKDNPDFYGIYALARVNNLKEKRHIIPMLSLYLTKKAVKKAKTRQPFNAEIRDAIRNLESIQELKKYNIFAFDFTEFQDKLIKKIVISGIIGAGAVGYYSKLNSFWIDIHNIGLNILPSKEKDLILERFVNEYVAGPFATSLSQGVSAGIITSIFDYALTRTPFSKSGSWGQNRYEFIMSKSIPGTLFGAMIGQTIGDAQAAVIGGHIGAGIGAYVAINQLNKH